MKGIILHTFLIFVFAWQGCRMAAGSQISVPVNPALTASPLEAPAVLKEDQNPKESENGTLTKRSGSETVTQKGLPISVDPSGTSAVIDVESDAEPRLIIKKLIILAKIVFWVKKAIILLIKGFFGKKLFVLFRFFNFAASLKMG